MKNNRPKIPRNVLIVAFVALASGFGQDLITPILPSFLLLIGIDRAGIGLIDGLLQGVTSIFQFVSGFLSDRYRYRKAFVFFGYALSSIARPLLALANSFGFVAALRVMDGIGKGTKSAPRDALVADSTNGAGYGRAFGFHRFIDTAGSVLGPLAAAGLLLLLTPSLATYRTIFALAIIPGAIALALIIFGIKEPSPKDGVIKKQTTKLPWRFWLFVIATTIATLTKINDSLFLVRAHDTGIPSGLIPVLFAGFTFIYAALSYPIGVWSDKIGKLPFIAAGWFILSIVEFGFARLPSIPVAIILFSAYGLFFALTEGSARAIIADTVHSNSRGKAYSIFHSFTAVAVIVGGYGLGRVWDKISPALAFDIAAAGSFIGCAILFTMLISSRKNTSRI